MAQQWVISLHKKLRKVVLGVHRCFALALLFEIYPGDSYTMLLDPFQTPEKFVWFQEL